MAKQHISLGATPADESCAQVGEDGYLELARIECRRYVAVLRDTYTAEHGAIPEGLNIKVVSNPHDFGAYLDVVAEFDETDEQAAEAALWLANNGPAEWPQSVADVAV